MKQFKIDIKQDRESVEKYHYLSKWFNNKLKIDYDAALSFLEEQFRKGRSKGKEKDLRKFNCGFVSIYKLHNGIFPFKVDDNVERLHTILTNMGKGLRNFVTYGGKPLVAVDLKNSQPFFSCCLFNPEFYVRNETEPQKFNIYNISEKIKTIAIQQYKVMKEISNYIMLVKKSYNSTSTCGGFTPYIEQNINGTFYEGLKYECEVNYDFRFYDRKDAKHKYLFYFFSDNVKYSKANNQIKYIISQIIPDVDHVFSLFKENDYRFLSKVLQSMESKLILKIIAKRIAKEHPEMPIFTVHDSIVSFPENKDYISRIMIEEIQNATGLMPSVDFEKWF